MRYWTASRIQPYVNVRWRLYGNWKMHEIQLLLLPETLKGWMQHWKISSLPLRLLRACRLREVMVVLMAAELSCMKIVVVISNCGSAQSCCANWPDHSRSCSSAHAGS